MERQLFEARRGFGFIGVGINFHDQGGEFELMGIGAKLFGQVAAGAGAERGDLGFEFGGELDAAGEIFKQVHSGRIKARRGGQTLSVRTDADGELSMSKNYE